MNNTVKILIVVAIVVLIGAYFLFAAPQNTPVNNNGATSTGSTNTTGGSTGTGNPPVAVEQAGAPIVVTDQSTVSSNSTVVVTGKVTPDGDQTSYWYEYGASTALGTRTSESPIGSGFVAISAPDYITGLRANTTYYYRLSARNSFGTVTGSTYSFSTNSNPPPKGGVPTVHTTAATNVQRTAANLNGQINPNNSQTTYWFEYGPGTSLGSITTFQPLASGNALANVSALVTDLKPLTKYFFRLNAQNQYGTVIGPVQNFTTHGPATSTATSSQQ